MINNEIESMCAKFWWGATGKDKKVHWKAWKSLKSPKMLGGLGFRDLTHFNKALLAKQIQRIVENPNSLVARVLKARYFKHTNIMEASLSSNPSYLWRSLLWSRDIIRARTLWKVGNCHTINARWDAWIPSLSVGRIRSNISYDCNVYIKDVINNSGDWDIQKAKSMFLPFEVNVIQKVPTIGTNHPDRRFWQLEKNGTYSVKAGYWNTTNQITDSCPTCEKACSSTKDQLWNKFWSLQIPFKIRIFIQKMVHDIIATEANLIHHHVPGNPRCALCGFYCANTTCLHN